MSRFVSAFAALVFLALSEVFAEFLPHDTSFRWIALLGLGTATIPAFVVSRLLRTASGPLDPARIARAQQISMSGPLLGFFFLLAAGGRIFAEHSIPPQLPGVAAAAILAPLVVGWALALAPQIAYENLRDSITESTSRAIRRELRPIGLILSGYLVLIALGDISWAVPTARESLFNNPGVSLVGVFALISGVALVSPFAVRTLYPSRPLIAGSLRDRLEQTAKSAGVTLREIYVWETGPRPVINACVSGVLPAHRSVFITDGLIELLDETEIEGVFAHELAHGTLHHLWIYLGLVIGLTGVAIGGLAGAHRWGLGSIGGESVEGLLLLVIGVFFFRFFGTLSRHFESEADIYSAEQTGSPFGIISALGRIGGLTGSTHRRGWRHPPIPHRIATVLACWNDPIRRARFVRRTRRLVTIALSVIALGMAGWAVEFTGRLSSPQWERDLSRAAYLLESSSERLERPWSDPQREDQDLRKAVDLISGVLTELNEIPGSGGALHTAYQLLAFAYDRLEEPWSAATARYFALLHGRRIR
jgi:Zn-dependent protease with chaperone function